MHADVVSRWIRRDWLVAATVFVTALLVRAAYLVESAHFPTFNTPLVDAGTYDALARTVANGEPLGENFFWQPVYYPTFLGGVYWASGGSILFAKIVQALIGAATCVLVLQLGRSLIDRRVGIVAGLVTALCGPLVFFDGELLATTWAAFWCVALVLLFHSAGRAPSVPKCLGLGLCAGLAVITRPTFLPFVCLTFVWTLVMWRKNHRRTLRSVGFAAVVVAGFAVVALPVAIASYRVAGRFSILPTSGGINTYIGNSQDRDRLIALRPGWDWDELTRMPARFGVTQSRDTPEFFYHRVLEHARRDPLDVLAGAVAKTAQFVCSRELPRNTDIYLQRRESSVLSALVWKIGAFGFPFGILLPTAAIGLVCSRRRFPAPVWLFLVWYPASVIAVFVTARYRAPVLPVLAVPAAAGIMALVEMVRRRMAVPMIVAIVGAMAVVLAATVPGLFPQESTNYEAEMDHLLASRARDDGRLAEAVGLFAQALSLDPDYGDAHNGLGVTLQRMGRTDEALRHYAQAVRINPKHVTARLNLARLLADAGRPAEAVEQFLIAVEQDPINAGARNSLGIAYARLKQFDKAADQFSKAARLDPKNPDTLNNLCSALYEMGQTDQAIDCYRRVLAIDPHHQAAAKNLKSVLGGGGAN